MDSTQMPVGDSVAGGYGGSSEANNMNGRAGFRRSLDLAQQQQQSGMDFSYLKDVGTENMNNAMKSPPASQAMPPKLQTSFSANDIHAKAGSVNGSNNAHAQQHFHNHNASIGRIPPGAVPKQHNRELSNDGHVPGMPQSSTYPSIGSALHANAPAFGPAGINAQGPTSGVGPVSSAPNANNNYQPYYGNGGYNNNTMNPNGGGGYNMGMLMQGMNNMNMGGYPQQNYQGYGAMFQPGQQRDSQQRVIQARRAQDNEGKILALL